jgi:hypothetical protein
MAYISSSQLRGYTDDDEHIYYNIRIVNSTNTPVNAVYNEYRTEPLIDTPGEYHLAVIRAEIDSAGIPLYIHRDNGLAAANPSYTSNYRVYMEYGGDSASAYVKYVSENANDANQSNRYVYSINHFLKMVNAAFLEAFNALDVLAALPSTLPPYIIYNADTSLFTFVAHTAYENAIGVFMNTELWSMFGNFEYQFHSNSSAVGKDYQIVIRNRFNNIGTTALSAPYVNAAAYLMNGEFVVNNCSDLDRLVLVSSTLPISKEFVPSLSDAGAPTGLDSSLHIITDFLTSSEQTVNRASSYAYVPTIYRYIDCVGSSPITNINIAVYWMSKRGILYPVVLNGHSFITMKLMFQKKGY